MGSKENSGGQFINAIPQFITNANGEKTAVILTLSDYEELMETLNDLAAIAERKDEESVSFDTVLKEMGLFFVPSQHVTAIKLK